MAKVVEGWPIAQGAAAAAEVAMATATATATKLKKRMVFSPFASAKCLPRPVGWILIPILVLMAWNVACDLRQLFWIFSIIYDLGEVVRLVFAFSHEQEEFYYNAVIILPLWLPCSYYLIIFLYSFPSLFTPLHVHIQICVTYD